MLQGKAKEPREPSINRCEQIIDDFNISFSEWLNVSDYRYKKGIRMYKHFLKSEYKSTTELQQYFKENVYGK
jgi:hypothetical protein